MKKISILSVLFFLLIYSVGCKDSIDSEPKEPGDLITGMYFVEGEKIIYQYPTWPIEDGHLPVIDTIRVEIALNIQLQDDRETIRLVGVPGADVGIFEHRMYPNCTQSRDCEIYGTKTSEDNFEINLSGNGRTYQANLFLKNYFELEAKFQYQSTTIDYNLTGQRYFE